MRMNLENPFCSSQLEFEFDLHKYVACYIFQRHQKCILKSVAFFCRCPKETDDNWMSIPISEVDDKDKYNRIIDGFEIPTIGEEDLKAIFDLNIGSYWQKRVGQYFLLLRQYELKDKKEEFKSMEEEIEAYKGAPESTVIRFRVLREEPKNWSSQKFGDFPLGGLLIAYCRYIHSI